MRHRKDVLGDATSDAVNTPQFSAAKQAILRAGRETIAGLVAPDASLFVAMRDVLKAAESPQTADDILVIPIRPAQSNP